MLLRNGLVRTAALCSGLAASLIAQPGWADLQKFISKPEAEFAWNLTRKIDNDQTGGRIYDLRLVSQTWQKTNWQHQLQIYQPAGVIPNAKMFLWVTGGSSRPDYVRLGTELARKMKAPVAFLYHIPNQPLLEEGLFEDDLI
ncbi:MAG TPA: PhoPQ-activated protein PqaA family protein, partial [Candidatus Binatia bacterium]|nr:PhoPQ-activated protein PqaA family protein [Candidatus Binatia bacterium]